MGIFSFLGSSGAETQKMKTIIYRGGVVEFRIPSSWKEEYSDMDGGTFYEDRPDSGTLRLKVITMKSPTEVTRDSSVQILNTLKQVHGRAELQSNGNALARYEDSTIDRGHPIRIIHWFVANAIPPDNARISTFSYTILRTRERDPRVVQEIEMLDREIRAAKFAGEAGIPPNRPPP